MRKCKMINGPIARVGRAALVAAVIGGLAAGCGVELPTSAANTSTNGSSAGNADQTTGGGQGGTATSGSPSATGPVSATFNSGPSSSLDCDWSENMLTGIRVGWHEGFDRVVFDFDNDGAEICYSITFESDPLQDGSGFPVDLGGKAALRVELPFLGPDFPTLTPGYRAKLDGGTSVAFAQFDTFFEGTATSFIALAGTEAPQYAVAQYPGRLVIDVR